MSCFGVMWLMLIVRLIEYFSMCQSINASREHSRDQELWRGYKWGRVLGRVTLNRSSGLILLIVLQTYSYMYQDCYKLGQFFNLKNTDLSTSSVY